MADDPLVSMREAADQLGLHPETLKRWIRSGGAPGRMLGGRYKLLQSEVDDLKNHGTRPSGDHQPEA